MVEDRHEKTHNDHRGYNQIIIVMFIVLGIMILNLMNLILIPHISLVNDTYLKM